jgi:DNA-binding MarR family transcriptional regulator
MLRCDNSNVTGIVDRLEARGLVARQPYEGDRRVRQVALTPLGTAARERIRDRMSTAPDSLRRLPAADQRTLRDVLRRALDAG